MYGFFDPLPPLSAFPLLLLLFHDPPPMRTSYLDAYVCQQLNTQQLLTEGVTDCDLAVDGQSGGVISQRICLPSFLPSSAGWVLAATRLSYLKLEGEGTDQN